MHRILKLILPAFLTAAFHTANAQYRTYRVVDNGIETIGYCKLSNGAVIHNTPHCPNPVHRFPNPRTVLHYRDIGVHQYGGKVQCRQRGFLRAGVQQHQCPLLCPAGVSQFSGINQGKGQDCLPTEDKGDSGVL